MPNFEKYPLQEAPLMQFGGGPNPESVHAVRQAIADILGSGAEQKTLRAALTAMSTSLTGSPAANCAITGCSFVRPSTEQPTATESGAMAGAPLYPLD